MKKIFTLIAAIMMAVGSYAAEVIDYQTEFGTGSKIGWKAGCVSDDNVTADADGLHIKNVAVQPNFWDFQFWLFDGVNLTVGDTYKVTIVCKKESEDASDAKVRYKVGNWDGGFTGEFNVTSTEYKEYTFSGVAAQEKSGLLLQYGDFVGTVSFKSVTISHESNATFEVDYQKEFGAGYSIGWKADCVSGDNVTTDADGVHVKNVAVQPNFWDFQFWLFDGVDLTVGQTYKVTVVCKRESDTDANAKVRYKVGNWDGGFTGEFNVTSNEYKEYTFSGVAAQAKSGLLLQYGDFVGTVSFKSVTISHEATGAPVDDYMLQIDLAEAKANNWDSQVIINIPTLEAGKHYAISMSVKGSVDGEELGVFVEDNSSTNRDGNNNSNDLSYGNNFKVTTDWKDTGALFYYKDSEEQWHAGTNGAFPYNRLILNIGKYAGTLYIDNIKIVEVESGNESLIDFKTGVNGIVEKRSWHNHVTISKAASDCTTGVQTVETKTVNSDAMYNIAGQRVQNAKGIVIKNGKKYVF